MHYWGGTISALVRITLAEQRILGDQSASHITCTGCVGAESEDTAVVSLIVGKGLHRAVAVHHTIGRNLAMAAGHQ